jgi:hypothetical protein
MSMLFDIQPADGGGKKKRSRRPGAVAVVEPVFSHAPVVHRAVAPQILHRVDDTFDCADAACGAQCHDVVQEEGGYWYLVCVFCGTGQWVEALVVEEPQEEAAGDVFLMPGGRFPGMTLHEVSCVEDGPAYIAWAATNHKRQDVREACQAHLDRRGSAD